MLEEERVEGVEMVSGSEASVGCLFTFFAASEKQNDRPGQLTEVRRLDHDA